MGLSEKKIIGEICRDIGKHPSVIIPAGFDDTAAVNINKKTLVFTSDIMFESTHFPKGMKPEEMGRKAVIANLSDIASMGAKPLYVLLSLGIPKNHGKIARLVLGITDACKEYGVVILGGDTKCSKELTISLCAIGEMKGRILARNNARAGDVIAVTGDIGSAFCGLHSMINHKSAP
jgi:thiamine-monophosphate kinase